jgi:hypothetical protein
MIIIILENCLQYIIKLMEKELMLDMDANKFAGVGGTGS